MPNRKCVKCGGEADNFRDGTQVTMSNITGYCQECLDKIEEERDEADAED